MRPLPYHTTPEPPIFIRQRRVVTRPNWPLLSCVLISIGLWWIFAWLIWGL